MQAHFTQFTQPGWRFLSVASGGSGYLPGGGAYATLVPAGSLSDVTIILESLQGDCLRCKGGKTQGQSVTFQLTGGLPGPGTTLRVWATNSTSNFMQLAPVTVGSDGSVTVYLPPDSIMTLTTITTGAKGSFPSVPIPPSKPFPLPYTDSFSGYAEDALARYFSDQAGSFAVRGGALHQVVAADPGPNAWVGDNDPISLIGDAGWSDITISVSAWFNGSAAGQPSAPRPVFLHDTTVGVDAVARAAERAHVPARLAAHGATPRELRPLGDAAVAAKVTPCNAASPHQKWAFNAPAQGYLSNAAGSAGIGGAACLNVDSCGTDVVYYDCVTSGGTCAGANNYSNLQWAWDAGSGRLTSAFDGLCLTWTGGAMNMVACAPSNPAAAGQAWAYNASSQQLELSGTGLCLTTPEPATYVQLCGRITGYSGFTIQTVPGYCMRVDADTRMWSITAGPKWGVVASGPIAASLPSWNPSVSNTYALQLNGNAITATAGGVTLGSFTDDDATYSVGLAALGSGYHYAVFDDFAVAPSN